VLNQFNRSCSKEPIRGDESDFPSSVTSYVLFARHLTYTYAFWGWAWF